MADYTEEQLWAKLERADAAGDTEAAKVIAEEIRRLQANPTVPANDLMMPDGSSATRVGNEMLRDAEEYRRNLPTNDMSFGETTAAGLGKVFNDTYTGIRQRLGLVDEAEVDEQRRLDEPLMQTWGGNLGYIGGASAAMATPAGRTLPGLVSRAGRAAPYIGAAGRSAAFQATQPVATGESLGSNVRDAALLGVVGQGIANGANRVAAGAVERLDPVSRGLAQMADNYGFRLSLPQLSNNPLVRTVNEQLDRLPFSGAGKRAEANQGTFNRNVGATFGAAENRITPEVFAGAKRDIGSIFDELSARNSLRPDAEMEQNVLSLLDETSRLGLPDHARLVRNWKDDLGRRADADGNIPGEGYKEWRSKLGKVLKGGGSEAEWLGRLREVVEEGMDRSISPTDAKAWREVRRMYANLKMVEPLVAKSVDGNISPAALMGRVTSDSAGKTRMAAGNAGPLGDLARIGQAYLKPQPNSGTADRLLVNLGVGGTLFGANQTGLIDANTALGTGALLLANRGRSAVANSRGITMGKGKSGKTLKGLARMVAPAPRALPAAASSLRMLVAPDDENALAYLQD